MFCHGLVVNIYAILSSNHNWNFHWQSFKLVFLSEIRKLQQLARRHSLKIIDENQKLRSELESKMQELDSRSKELDELASQSDYDRRNLQQEKEKVCDGLLAYC